jgi:hypothetical protein
MQVVAVVALSRAVPDFLPHQDSQDRTPLQEDNDRITSKISTLDP